MSQSRNIPPTTAATAAVGAAPTATASPPRPRLRLGAILAVSCIAQFMIVLDSTIVAVALPDMRTALRLSAEQQQWVVDGYLVALGGLLLLAARIGDVAGHRRVFQFGLAVFTLASLAGGLASDGPLLIAARVVQGVGGAALGPSSLSLIATTHTEPAKRMKALALWSMTGGVAGAVGVVLGGVLTAELDWRWVLFVNVPIGAALMAVSFSVLPRTRGRAAGGPRLDLPGGLLATIAAALLTYGFSLAPQDGWTSVQVLGSLIATPVLLAVFVLVETRSGMPLVPSSFFRSAKLCIGNGIMLCIGATMTGGLVLITLYLQQSLGYSALRSGLALLPMTVTLVGGALLSRPVLHRFGPRVPLIGGGLIAAAGMAWMADISTHPAYLAHVLGPTVVTGLGISSILLSATISSTAGVEPRDAGSASGLLTTSRQLGGALGLAALVSVADFAARSGRGVDPGTAVVHGYRIAFLTSAGIMILAVLAALGLRRERVPRD